MLHLVTGHKGVAHIKSENIKDFNRDATAYSSFTSGTFIISSGEDTSKLKVNSGFGYIEGRMFEIERGTTEEVSFDLANSGYHRIDKVVARYFEEDGVESVYLDVVRGVEVLESVEIEPSEQTPEECVIFYAEITSSRADLYSYGRVSIVEENATCISEKSFSHSEGDSTNALGECSHSEGSNSTANGYAAHAGGYYCSARGDQSFAHGENALARGDNSVAIGRELIADDGQTVFGRLNKTEDDALFIVGNGDEEEFERSNAFVITENDAIIHGKSFNQLNNDLHDFGIANLYSGDLYNGYIDNDTGEVASFKRTICTPNILPCEPDKNFVLDFETNISTSELKIAFYNGNTKLSVNVFNTSEHTATTKAPSNANGYRFQITRTDESATFPISEVKNVMCYQGYLAKELGNVNASLGDYNMVNVYDGSQGGYWNATDGVYNSYTDNNTRICSKGKIPCVAGKPVHVKADKSTTMWIVFYNSSGAFISYEQQVTKEIIAIAPPNATSYTWSFKANDGVTPTNTGYIAVYTNNVMDEVKAALQTTFNPDSYASHEAAVADLVNKMKDNTIKTFTSTSTVSSFRYCQIFKMNSNNYTANIYSNSYIKIISATNGTVSTKTIQAS